MNVVPPSPLTALVFATWGVASVWMLRGKKYLSVSCGPFKVTAADKPPESVRESE